jgi:hypothetical protein
MKEERELNDMAEVLKNLTIAFVENKTKCISETYRYAYRTVGEFGLSVPCLASERAYNDFYNRTGLDIRMYKRGQEVKDKFSNKFVIHREYTYEHIIPAVSFKNSLIDLYNEKNLNIDTIKEKILEQKMCWITKEENKKLNQLGYQYKGRETFEKAKKAYIKAGIKIIE